MNTVTIPAVSTRYDFLDWLRVIAIFVLLFFHTGMLFVGWGWHIENAEVLTALQLPMDIAHRLRMPLLFVIAGAGMWFALGNRHGGGIGARAEPAPAAAAGRRHAADRAAADLLRAAVPRPVGRRLPLLLLRARAAVPAVSAGRLQLASPLVRRLSIRLRVPAPAAAAVVARGQEGREAGRVAVRAGDSAGAERGDSQAAVSRSRTS